MKLKKWGTLVFPGKKIACEELCNKLEIYQALYELPKVFKSNNSFEEIKSNHSLDIESNSDSHDEGLSVERDWNWERVSIHITTLYIKLN